MEDEPKYGPYATREDIQALRADLIERIGTFETRLTERVSNVETRLGDRISKLEGQVMMLNRVSFLTLAAVVAGAVKILFFG